MPGRIELSGVAGPSVSGTVTVRAVLQGVPEYRFNRRVFLVDGRVVGRDPTLRWDSQTVEDGVHRLRVVAYSTGLVRQQLFAERELKVENRRP
jgi:hypothetical protein